MQSDLFRIYFPMVAAAVSPCGHRRPVLVTTGSVEQELVSLGLPLTFDTGGHEARGCHRHRDLPRKRQRPAAPHTLYTARLLNTQLGQAHTQSSRETTTSPMLRSQDPCQVLVRMAWCWDFVFGPVLTWDVQDTMYLMNVNTIRATQIMKSYFKATGYRCYLWSLVIFQLVHEWHTTKFYFQLFQKNN